MSQLSAQSIRQLCQPPAFLERAPLITPFEPEKKVINGKSYGLSSASYDCRIAHDLTLGVAPGVILAQYIRDGGWDLAGDDLVCIRDSLRDNPPSCALAYTVEDFHMPDNVVGYVVDKSSYARRFLSAMNTLIDPGFVGNLTLELVNHSDNPIEIKEGDPICQIAFYWLDQATDRPYEGKYQHQTKAAHGPRDEEVSDHEAEGAMRYTMARQNQ